MKSKHPKTASAHKRRLHGVVRRAGFDAKILARTKYRWTVYHPDGVELGLLPVTFKSQRMARQSAASWNKKYRGHRVLAPNAELSDRRANNP